MYKLTKQQVQDEILKCGKNPVYFINTYCKISHPQRGPIPFRMYPFQEDVVKDFQDHRFSVILKARQLGLSTGQGTVTRLPQLTQVPSKKYQVS